jgi:hypothetical protein
MFYICSPVVAPRGAVIIKLASTNSGGAVPAVVPPENEIRGLVGEHLAVCQGLKKNRRGEGGCSSGGEVDKFRQVYIMSIASQAASYYHVKASCANHATVLRVLGTGFRLPLVH